jgi:hypothetical protein
MRHRSPHWPSSSGALVEATEAVLELLADENWQTPFVCPEHGFGLQALLAEGRAVWCCGPPNPRRGGNWAPGDGSRLTEPRRFAS